MTSPFFFLEAEWPALYDAAKRAAAAVHPDPRTACFYAHCSMAKRAYTLASGSRMSVPLGREVPVTQFPLIFNVKDTLTNDRFSVEISTKGKVLASVESDGVWLYGVNPGGLAGGGEDFDRAYIDFRTTFTNVMNDFVKEAQSVAEFEKMARAFLLETNEPTLADWRLAVDAIRCENVNIPGMRREPADQEPEIFVHEKSAAPGIPAPLGIGEISVTPFALAKAA